MITAGQLRAARTLIGIDQKTLANLAGISVQTVQWMEASDNLVRGVVESRTKVIEVLDRLGIELVSAVGGRGVRSNTVGIPAYKARDPAPGLPSNQQFFTDSEKTET